MTKDPSEPHAGRSAELQRLLEEAAHADSRAETPLPTNAGERTATTSEASPVISSAGQPGGDPADRSAEARPRQQPGPGPITGRPTGDIRGRWPLPGVSRSVRLAARRSAERRTRPAGPAAGSVRPGYSSRQLPVSRRTGISIEAARWRASNSRALKYPQAEVAIGVTAFAPGPRTPSGVPTSAAEVAAPSSDERQPARPRRTRQGALVLAGGMAAAAVATVAILVGGRVATAPTSVGLPPVQPAVVASVGADGQVSQLTVTAPTTTVGGTLVAVVAEPGGATRQLPVVKLLSPGSSPATTPTTPTATTPTTTASTTAGPATTAPTSTAPTSIDVAGTSRSDGQDGTPGTTVDPTSATQTPILAVQTPAPAVTPTPESGETATVVTGISKLTGWVIIGTTPSR